jgi:ATP-dependent Clp protease protease subunit
MALARVRTMVTCVGQSEFDLFTAVQQGLSRMHSTLSAHLPNILDTLSPDRRYEVLNAVNYQRTREMSIDELLLENRVVFLIGEINYSSAARVMMQMLYLENQKKGQDINFYINSPGGSVDDTLAVYDTMQFISSDVSTFCIGRAYSGGALLLAAGHPGKRICLPHAKVMIHQPLGGVTGQTTDIQIQAEHITKMKRTLNEILARHCNQPVEKVTKDSDRDKFFSADEAKAYGLVDEVAVFPDKSKK